LPQYLPEVLVSINADASPYGLWNSLFIAKCPKWGLVLYNGGMPQEEMDKELAGIFERCQRRYPTIDIEYEWFRARIEEILRASHGDHSGMSPCAHCLALLGQLHHEELFLAVACARGNRIAWEHFTDEYLSAIHRFASQACRGNEAGQDLAQEFVASLFGKPQESPDGCVESGKLSSYNGRGSLNGWLRASIAHAAIDRFRKFRKQVSLDEMAEQGNVPEAPNPDPEITVEDRMDSHWAPVLARSLEKELAGLEARDRLLLSLYHVYGIPLKKIGARFGVHEATASRWLERVRQQVRKRVETTLRKAHGLSGYEIQSLWRWLSEAGDPALNQVLRPLSGSASAKKKMQGEALESSSLGVGHE
jgi:RNA polymerase sigma-70 factor